MAKTEGDQEIPSGLLDAYRATLGEQVTGKGIGKRYPWHVKNMQAGGSGETPAQRIQRNRFKTIRDNFHTLSQADKERWYAAMPEYSSLLWYYNYFIMSGLSGNADITDGGAGVIKSIQFVKEEVPTTGGKSYTINAVDPTKTVVMMFGNSFIADKVQRGSSTIADGGTNNHVLSPVVDPVISEIRINGSGGNMFGDLDNIYGDWGAPYASALIAAQLTVKMVATNAPFTAGYSWEVIEHKAQTIYPVITSIAAEAVVIDWSKVPSVAADISIIVIEYI